MADRNRHLTPFDAQVLSLPASRLGRFLGTARAREGVSLGEIAQRLDWAYTPIVLRMIENGHYSVPAEDVQGLVDAYQIDVEALLVNRDPLEVDLEAGTLRAGDHVMDLGERLSINDLLSEYLSFVRSMRKVPPDGTITAESLRVEDMVVLAGIIRVEANEVEKRLTALLDPTGARAREAIARGSSQYRALAERVRAANEAAASPSAEVRGRPSQANRRD